MRQLETLETKTILNVSHLLIFYPSISIDCTWSTELNTLKIKFLLSLAQQMFDWAIWYSLHSFQAIVIVVIAFYFRLCVFSITEMTYKFTSSIFNWQKKNEKRNDKLKLFVINWIFVLTNKKIDWNLMLFSGSSFFFFFLFSPLLLRFSLSIYVLYSYLFYSIFKMFYRKLNRFKRSTLLYCG